MPRYDTLDQIPSAEALETWKAFNARVMSVQETKFIKTVLRRDIPALREEDAPLLVTIKAADDWQRTAIGRKPPYNCWWDYALRLYVYNPLGTVEDTQTLYDQLENANAVLLRLLRSEYMACNEPYWKELELVGGKPNTRTSVILAEKERLCIQTRLRIMRHFRPGQ